MEIMNSCLKHVKRDVLQDAFTFTFSTMKRYQGAWHTEKRPMFPNYIFLESPNGRELSEELNQYRSIVQVLESRDALQQVSPEEEHFLQNLCGSDHHMSMSRGYIRGRQTYITEGPLRGRETWIRKIDRHRRMAQLEAPVLQRMKHINAGLEIYAKE